MKVKCLHNSGKDLLCHLDIPRLTSEHTHYGELEIGKEYLVMGLILFNDHLGYLIDDEVISVCPYQLFEIIDSKLPNNWYFNNLMPGDTAYPYVKSIWGFHEMCFEKNFYEKLIVEMEEEAYRVYFKKKMELERELFYSGG